MLQIVVKTCKRDANGNLVKNRKGYSNPLLDTSLCKVEFPDGNIRKYAANVIAEKSPLVADDDEGRHHLLLEALLSR